MTSSRKSLAQWIEDALTDQDKAGPCSALQLCYKRGYSDQEIHAVQVSTGMQRTPAELSVMFRGKAEVHCQDMKGSQMFVLKAFYGTNEPLALLPFRVNPPAQDEHMGLDAEEPTAEGSLLQMMRANAQVFGELMRRQTVLSDQQNAFVELIGRKYAESMKENTAYQELVLKMMLDKIKLGHEEKMKELEFQRSTEERRKLMQFGPGLLNQIAGREVFPQPVADSQIIEGLAERISPEQLAMLEATGAIPAELMATIKTRFADHLAKREKESKETRELLGIREGAPALPSANAPHANGTGKA
jgi:hypothetical protein